MNASTDRGDSTVGTTGRRDQFVRFALLLLSGPIAWAVSSLVGRFAPGVAEAVYGGGFGAWGGFLLARATAWIPFSLAEFALASFVVFELGRLGRSLVRAPRWRRLGAATLRVLRDFSVVVAVFYLLWGFHYARPTLPERAQWPDFDLPLDERVALAGRLVDRANARYVDVHGTEDAGAATTLDGDGVAALDAALEAAWADLPADLALPDAARWTRGPVKHPVIAPLMHRLGISGFYFPFTGEANVNDGVPIVHRARVMSHEKAHQRGVGPEDEANFLGWMAAARADESRTHATRPRSSHSVSCFFTLPAGAARLAGARDAFPASNAT